MSRKVARTTAEHREIPLPDIVISTRDYERWLRSYIKVNSADLSLKHDRMAASPFSFLRSTFYRFLQRWPALAAQTGNLVQAPTVPSVGDIHLENFGTWRDAHGRLVWGVNDFDEATDLPYTLDLVRLAVSAQLASGSRRPRRAGGLTLAPQDAAAAILDGYLEGLQTPRPFVLEESHAWLRDLVLATQDPQRFWADLTALPILPDPRPRRAARLLRTVFPAGSELQFVHRTVGLGSLGRARLLAYAEVQGGLIASEAKAICPTAVLWANSARGAPGDRSVRLNAAQVMARSVRSADPSVVIVQEQGYVLRRLSPSTGRVNLADLPRKRDEQRLLRAMGSELANVHLGDPDAARQITRDLKRRPSDWLLDAAHRGAHETEQDWQAWRGR